MSARTPTLKAVQEKKKPLQQKKNLARGTRINVYIEQGGFPAGSLGVFFFRGRNVDSYLRLESLYILSLTSSNIELSNQQQGNAGKELRKGY